MDKQVNIYQIAKESGVSVSTVSRVLNGGMHVSQRSLDKVNKVIEKYQYTPSAVARAMASHYTKTIGVLMPDITNPYFSALFLEIERYALNWGYSVILCNTLYGGSSHGVENLMSEIGYLQMMKERMVDGVIVTGGQLDLVDTPAEYITTLNKLHKSIPVVIVGERIENCECLFVNRNLGGGVASMVCHLTALGNRRIGFIGGQEGVRQTSERLKAYREAMESLGLDVTPDMVELSDYYTADGYSAMERILDRGTRLQAVIAINDRIALGAIRAMCDRGMHVPKDMAVVSCDKFYDSEFYVPRLTTLDQQNDYLGRISIMLLLGAIAGKGEDLDIKHTPQLVINESCGVKLGIRRE